MLTIILIILAVTFVVLFVRGASRTETTIIDPPERTGDDLYGMDETEIIDRLRDCRARVRGTPGGGLHDTGFGVDRENAGRRGELSLAAALLHHGILDRPGVCVWFSLRNPGDETGRVDIDCILAQGGTVRLLDAKHYRPAEPESYLTRLKSGDLQGGGRRYRTSRSMEWALNAMRERLPHADVSALVLLCRTKGGVYGVRSDTVWPGGVRARNADRWLEGLPADPRPVDAKTIAVLDRLVKTPPTPGRTGVRRGGFRALD